MEKKIILIRRTEDYQACIEGHPEIWGCGQSIQEAIGDLILVHRDHFRLSIEGPG